MDRYATELILDKILADKRIEVQDGKSRIPAEQMRRIAADAPPPRDFASALWATPPSPRIGRGAGGEGSGESEIRLISEVKKASPSKGLIRPDFDPVWIGRTYEAAGASAISVLTDEKYFQGKLEYLTAVRDAVSIPCLRKDFIVDPYQVYEARAAKADAILLIVAALPKDQLVNLMTLASDLGMASLVEIHTAGELDIALDINAKIVGINNRNLQTFEMTLETTLSLAEKVPGDRALVSESGIFTRADVEALLSAGVDAILVGESLMREPDPGVKVRELLGAS